MKIKEALDIIRQACASVQANLTVHEQIQTALKAVEDELAKGDKQDNSV